MAQTLNGISVTPAGFSAVMEAQSYSLLLIEAPAVPAAELQAAARWRIKDIIDFPPDQAVVDVFDLPAQRQ